MAEDIVAWRYKDDNGVVYSRGVARYIADQVDGSGNSLIGEVAVTTLAQEPFNPAIKPRTVACINTTTGKRRRVVIMDAATSGLWNGGVTTISLHDGDGNASNYTVYSKTGERRRTRAPGL